MERTQYQPSNSTLKMKIKILLETALIGVTKGSLGLLLEHPFDTIKTKWQKINKIRSVSGIIQLMYKEHGFSGFYKGILPNLLKTSLKNLFRWPAMIYLPEIYKEKIEGNILYFDSLPKILTGLTISNIEVFGFAPLERLKVYLMTEKNGLKEFYAKHKNNLSIELFKGLEATYWKTNVSWLTFILSDHYLKRLWKEGFERQELSWTDLLSISFIVGLLSTFTTMPFDFVKTQQQVEKSVKVKNINVSTLTILTNHITLTGTSGLKLLYTGWNLRFSQIMINSTVAIYLLEKLEKKHQNQSFH